MKAAAESVRVMQAITIERLASHEARGAAAAGWVAQREERRPWLTVLLRAWRAVVGVPSVLQPTMESSAWEEWKAKEKPRDRKARRLGEGVRRLSIFANLMIKADKKQRIRTNLRAAVMKVARRRRGLRRRMQRAGRRATGLMLMARARDGARHGGRSARASTTMSTVQSLMKEYAPKRRGGCEVRGAVAVRLTRAAAIGRVLLRWLITFEGVVHC